MNVWIRRSAGITLLSVSVLAASATAAQAGYTPPPPPPTYSAPTNGNVVGNSAIQTNLSGGGYGYYPYYGYGYGYGSPQINSATQQAVLTGGNGNTTVPIVLP